MAIISIGACQINSIVGDIAANCNKILDFIKKAADLGCDIAVTPELAVTGYPPEDLLHKRSFVDDQLGALEELVDRCKNLPIVAIIGHVSRNTEGAGRPGLLYNSASVICQGKLFGPSTKRLLPNYAVFDEVRYFESGGPNQPIYQIGGVRFSVAICEDIWQPEPIADLVVCGTQLVISLNASPFFSQRASSREAIVAKRVEENQIPLVYVNAVGGQDELVFDGGSFAIDHRGTLLSRAPQFKESLSVIELEVKESPNASEQEQNIKTPTGNKLIVVSGLQNTLSQNTLSQETLPRQEAITAKSSSKVNEISKVLSVEEEIYQALVLGTKDYVEKNGFEEVVIGLSGGIDSALVSVIARDAIGPMRVHCVAMPSKYSSPGSLDDALDLSRSIGVELRVIPISDAHQIFSKMVERAEILSYPTDWPHEKTSPPPNRPSEQTSPPPNRPSEQTSPTPNRPSEQTSPTPNQVSQKFAPKTPSGLADENLQSRIRGVTLMLLSNQYGWLVLTTGNKSEIAVGYSTLYGDTAGGFAVIKDVPKTMVYRLCEFRNSLGEPVIPDSIINKAPTAELRADQRDDQSLPPYDLLDKLLDDYVNMNLSHEELVAKGFDDDVTRWFIQLVEKAEYKRRQSPPGVRVSEKAFGKDRRMPITNHYSN